MINPSKARHDVDDHTMTKCCGFARRHLARGILIVNLFAYSATDPKDMIAAHGRGVDVRGEHNTAAMLWALTVRRNNGCDRAVPLRGVSFPEIETGVTHLTVGRNIAAWGRVPPSLRMSALNSSQLFSHHSPDCFGTNADGSPKHPLMLAYDTQLVRYIP
jgi:hypothetical protein